MTEQIVDIVEANMPASSDVVNAARGAGAAAGEYAGQQAANAAIADVKALADTNKTRLDTLIAAPASGDAELVDIRVGRDGEAYETAGSAVRSQVTNVARSVGMMSVASIDCDTMTARMLFDNVTVYAGKNFDPSNVSGMTVENFASHLMDSSVGSISAPVRVRTPDGNLAVRNIKVSASTANSIAVVCFGRDGSYLRHCGFDRLPDPLISADVYWMAFLQYANYPGLKWVLEDRTVDWLNPRHMSEPTIPAPGIVGVTTQDPFASVEIAHGKTIDVSPGQAVTIDTWHEHLSDVDNSIITQPIRVRYTNGNPVYPLLRYTGSSAGYLYYGFDAQGRLLGRYDANNWASNNQGFDADVYYASLIDYKNNHRVWDIGSMSLDWLHTSTEPVQYTVGNGGDYASLTECLQALQGDTRAKTIRILPGEYDIFAELGGAAQWAAYDGDANWRDVQPVVPPNTHLLGVGRVTLRMTPSADQISAKAASLLSPLNVSWTATIENLTIIAKNCRYAIHDEASGRDEFANSEHTYRHVTAIKQSSDGIGYTQTLGCGEACNGRYLFEDCVIRGAVPFSIHTNRNAAGDGTNITFRHCLLETSGAAYSVGLSTSWDNLGLNHVIFDSCHIKAGIRTYNEQSNSDKENAYQITMLNCNADATITHSNANSLDPLILNPIHTNEN